ncbi:hypothetical protein [Scytonema sp. NUACC26]|uniref:hypothetical protein n=1 Tax=Scytonema sp. NUACC26 TaxID=3140176 RepID=UPI0034DCA7DE
MLHSDVTYAPEKYDYHEFSTVFESVEQFNKTEPGLKIQTSGFEISFLYGFRSKLPDKEAEAVRRAYLEYYNKV